MKTLRCTLALAAMALIGLGVWLGEPAAQMMNAVMICLACIGVG